MVTQSTEGTQLQLSIAKEGRTIVEPSPLGISTAQIDFVEGLSFVERTDSTIDESYETTTGKRLSHDHRGNQTTLTFEKGGQRIHLDVRVAAQGVGYRYRFPGDGDVSVTGEESGFRLPSGASGWTQPWEGTQAFPAAYENLYRQISSTDSSGEYAFGTTFEATDEDWVLISEADISGRYAASHLSTSAGDGLFNVVFPDDLSDGTVDATRPLRTPWRVAIVGDLATVTESDLIQSLSPASTVEDTSWITPGRADWSWWSQDRVTSFERQKEYVDYASDHGWEFTLVDVGWSEDWMPDLVDYANERGVEIVLWSRWDDDHLDIDPGSAPGLADPDNREELLSRWSEWGVAGIKVDFMNSDSQERMEFYDELLEATAEYELMVNFHGASLPKGRRRTWPHEMTREAVRGAEYYKFGNVTPTHNAILPFTRNVVGAMDYTPTTFSASDQEPRTTPGHELALSVVFESGQQHLADSIDVYEQWPTAERFLDRIAAAWDETQLVDGRPGEEVVMARRKGSEWFVGVITAGSGQEVDVPLDFLDDGTDYIAEVTSDDNDGGLVRNDSGVTSEDTISVEVPENGGFTVYLLEAADRAPPTNISAAFADDDEIEPGEGTQITVTLTNNGASDVASGDFTIDAPDGWMVQADDGTAFGTVAPEASAEATWMVTAPEDVTRGRAFGLTIEATYTDENGNDRTRSVSPSLRVPLAPFPPVFSTFASRRGNFGTDGDVTVLQANGTEMFSGFDEYGAVYLDNTFESGDTATVRLLSRGLFEAEFAKAGLMVRNDITGDAESEGYVVVAQENNSPLGGDRGAFTVQRDSDGNGILDDLYYSPPDNTYPAWLRVERDGISFTGSFKTSADGEWTEIATIDVPSAAEVQDVGMFVTSNNANQLSEARFADFDAPMPVGPPPVVGDARPTDPDGDGRYEDVNGDGEVTYADVVDLFENFEESPVQDNPEAFDFNGNGRLDFDDIIELFESI